MVVHTLIVHVDMPDGTDPLDAENIVALGVARELSSRGTDGNVRVQHIGILATPSVCKGISHDDGSTN